MILEFFGSNASWAWLIAGLVLLILEIAVSGIFLIWFGLAALAIGILSLLFFEGADWWSWQVQGICFGIVSLLLILASIRLFPTASRPGAVDDINRPLARHIGSFAQLETPIENGKGRAKLGDTTWRVIGADMEAGTRVKIIAVKRDAFEVEKA